jgi:hypothetical protein
VSVLHLCNHGGTLGLQGLELAGVRGHRLRRERFLLACHRPHYLHVLPPSDAQGGPWNWGIEERREKREERTGEQEGDREEGKWQRERECVCVCVAEVGRGKSASFFCLPRTSTKQSRADLLAEGHDLAIVCRAQRKQLALQLLALAPHRRRNERAREWLGNVHAVVTPAKAGEKGGWRA